jgi:nuclear GTP-binding protein
MEKWVLINGVDKTKDPGIPNNFPYKEQVLAEMAEQKRLVSPGFPAKREEALPSGASRKILTSAARRNPSRAERAERLSRAQRETSVSRAQRESTLIERSEELSSAS